MKFIIALAAFVAVACAAPPSDDAAAVIEKSSFENKPEQNSYHYDFALSNGINADESGQLKELKDEEGKPASAIVSTGSYSYTGPDGQKYLVNYVADENGFQPTGDHLPVVPPPA